MPHKESRPGRGSALQPYGNGVGAHEHGANHSPWSAHREDDPGNQLSHYGRIIWARRAIVIGIVLLVVGATAVATFLQAPVYRASGMVELRQPSDDLEPVDALYRVPQVSDQHLETQYELLKSTVLARRVALDALAEPVEPDLERNLDAATRWVQRNLTIDPLRGSRLVRVAFESEDPELAARIVNSAFRQFSALRVEAARGAVERLAAQRDTSRVRLSEAEGRLQEYVRDNGLLFLESGSGESENLFHERLQRLQQEVTEVEADRYEKEALYNLLREGETGHLESGVLGSLDVRLAELKAEHARLLSTFTEDYPRTQQVKRQLDELEALVSQERDRVVLRVQNDYRAALDRENLIRSAFQEQKRAVDGMAGTVAEYHVLRREVEGHLNLHADLQRKQKEAEVSAAAATTEIALVEAAIAPPLPIRPVPGRDLPLALVVGLVLGIAAAFLREYTDTAVHSAEELHSVTEVPILGIIPSADRALKWRENGRSLASGTSTRRAMPSRGLPPSDGRRLLAEAFGGLRTSVLFDMDDSAPRSLLITSSQPGEGKTTIAMNLAMSLARLGRRTLLIDADTRRPAVHQAFELEREPGLANYLQARGHWLDMVVADVVPGLDVLPAGCRIDSPSDALSSPLMKELIDEAGREYGFVVVDSPALMINAADTRTLAPLVDGVLLVVRSGATSRETVRHVVSRTPRVIGVVLNDLDIRKFTAYYGDYENQDAFAPDGRPREGVAT